MNQKNNNSLLFNDDSEKMWDWIGFGPWWFSMPWLHINWTNFNKHWHDYEGYDRGWFNRYWFNRNWFHINWTKFDNEWYNEEWIDKNWHSKHLYKTWKNEKWPDWSWCGSIKDDKYNYDENNPVYDDEDEKEL